MAEGPEPLQREDLLGSGRRYGGDTRADGFAAGKHRTRPALPEPTTEPRPIQPQVVPQHVEQRSSRIDVNCRRASVHSEVDSHIDVEFFSEQQPQSQLDLTGLAIGRKGWRPEGID